jgi:hypothetical protein
MSRNDLASKLYYRACCFVLFFLAAAASFSGYYDHWHFREAGASGSTERNSFNAMVDGTADRPFVYRQLLPMTANWINQRVPEQIKDRLFAIRSGAGLLRESLFSSPVAQDRAYFFRYWIIYAGVFLFAWASVFAMYLVGRSAGYGPSTAAFSAVVMVLLIPLIMNGGGGGYLYDYPELAFLALAVWMALNFDWWWIAPVAALATWNKESFVLFIPALYPLLRQHSSRNRALIGTGVLGCT